MAGVTNNGFESLTRDQIVEMLNLAHKVEFGETFDVSPENPDGQLIGIIADLAATQWQMGEGAFNSFNPATASGVVLDNIVRLNGIRRRETTEATVTLQLTEAGPYFVGEYIPQGALVSTADGIEFALDEAVTLPATVTATATQEVNAPIAANEVNVIVTQGITGWLSVTNPESVTPSNTRETDTELRSRREKSVVRTGNDTADAIVSAVTDLKAESVTVIENDTAGVVGGVAANSFMVVADGGLSQDIAEAIFKVKPIGVSTFGAESEVVVDSQGISHTINFARPTIVSIIMTVTISKSGADASANADVQQALVDYINTKNMGDSVTWSKLFAPVNAVKGVEAVNIQLAETGNALGEVSLTLTNIEKAELLIGDVTIVEV